MANKNCYIYTRVSTARQIDGYSLEAQKQTLINYARYKDLHISGVYCDAGKSGKDIIGRPSFMQMMEDVRSQKDNISYVLVFKLSRFGRNSADILKSIQELNDYDIDLVSVKESIDSSTKGGKLTLSILSAVAEMEKENIKTQFLAGRLQKVLEGGFPGGVAPYGYRIENKELVLEPSEADNVKKMFELYLDENQNLNTVATKFELPPQLVGLIISDPIYYGIRYVNRRCRKKNSKEVFEAKSNAQAIISKEVFDKAQDKRNQLAIPFKNKMKNTHILSGLIECPVCKKRMSGIILKSKSRVNDEYCKPYNAYRCSYASRKYKNECSYIFFIRQEEINHYVFEVIKNLEFYKEFNDAIDNILKSKDELELLNKRLKDLKKELEDIEIAKDRIAEKIDALNPSNSNYDNEYNELSNILDDYYDKIDEIEIRIDATKEEIEHASKEMTKGQKCKNYISGLSVILDKMTVEEKRELCQLLIDRIEIDKDTKKVKSIAFKIPLAYEGDELVKDDSGETINFVLEATKIDVKPYEEKPKGTYEEIRQYIKDKYDVKVSTLYIAQIKRKYGVKIGKHYNKSKYDNPKVPKCPKEKEEMILDAFKHFEIEFKECE